MELINPYETGLKGFWTALIRDAESLLEMQSLVTVKVEYYHPDAPSVINPNPIIWQTEDFPPFLRIASFLCEWGMDRKIKATVSRVWLMHHRSGEGMLIQPQINPVAHEYLLN